MSGERVSFVIRVAPGTREGEWNRDGDPAARSGKEDQAHAHNGENNESDHEDLAVPDELLVLRCFRFGPFEQFCHDRIAHTGPKKEYKKCAAEEIEDVCHKEHWW
ncbi:hypothetical protein Mboo_0448 [Methanoregula boonei 6A8]|uniref:Uncharacterized protein n=1 Tax=Methanoregula boonei (strain DSM 21154 / JCM 14090 / 6A8) TaxID=456442 RepID=A7I5F5_METB6|nr:hypothetical protein Mboo_0448 [Methanoregula boonei 6A8]